MQEELEKESSEKIFQIQDLTKNSQFLEITDSELWSRFKKGDRASFIFIYNLYYDRLYAYSHQFTKDSALIKDCIQELFIKINNSRARLSETSSIKLYLYKAIKRDILRAIKGNRYLLFPQQDYSGLNFGIELSTEELLVNQQIDEEKAHKIKLAANKLNGRQREIIFYHFYEGFSLEEIKVLMNFQTEKAVTNLLYKAIKELRSIVFS